ncbi:hypothetical protein Cadr_000000107 [Camelus dromedarius]|uniref:Uncharacterized protein n=1 Tax=Camelus dromedarius TaxID=9838 RepID=A0A5N4EJU3_CAMDR|nr:hypothetical protein Cadr_000000107 [Camelus dromedarius]
MKRGQPSWYKTPIPEAANLRGENPELCVGRLSSTPGKGGRGGETVIFQPSNKDKGKGTGGAPSVFAREAPAASQRLSTVLVCSEKQGPLLLSRHI